MAGTRQIKETRASIPLRWKLSLIFSLFYFLIIIGAFIYLFISNTNDNTTRFKDSNKAYSEQSSTQVINLFANHYLTSFQILKHHFQNKIFQLNKDLIAVQVIKETGEIIFDSEELKSLDRYKGNRRIIKNDSLFSHCHIPETYTNIYEENDKTIYAVLIPYFDIFDRHISSVVFYYTFDSLNARYKATLIQILLLSLFTAAFGFVLTYVLVNYNFINPLKDLVDKIRLISSKHYNFSKEELRNMFTAKNEIKAISSWIENNTKKLEEIIEIRTLELEDKNRNLLKTASELKETQEKLIESAHQAGRAELASSVLHNIGNVITSINVKLNLLAASKDVLKISKLVKIYDLLVKKKGELDYYFNKDPKGQKFLEFFGNYIDYVNEQIDMINNNLNYLLERVSLITEILNTQQRYAGMNVIEDFKLSRILQDSFNIYKEKAERLNIKVDMEFDESIPTLKMERIKLHQVFVNIIKNAIEAIQMKENYDENIENNIQIITKRIDNVAQIIITDTGCGIKAEKIGQLFTWGFTTKQEKNSGHGFGLHSCANAINSMGGSIKVESKGIDQGATFVISIPIKQEM